MNCVSILLHQEQKAIQQIAISLQKRYCGNENRKHLILDMKANQVIRTQLCRKVWISPNQRNGSDSRLSIVHLRKPTVHRLESGRKTFWSQCCIRNCCWDNSNFRNRRYRLSETDVVCTLNWSMEIKPRIFSILDNLRSSFLRINQNWSTFHPWSMMYWIPISKRLTDGTSAIWVINLIEIEPLIKMLRRIKIICWNVSMFWLLRQSEIEIHFYFGFRIW